MASGGLCLVAGMQLWQLRQERRVRLLILTLLILCSWGIGNALLMLSPDGQDKIFIYFLMSCSTLLLAGGAYRLARILARPDYRPRPFFSLMAGLVLFSLIVIGFNPGFRQSLFQPAAVSSHFLIPGLEPSPAGRLLFFALPFGIFLFNTVLFLAALPRLSGSDRRLAQVYAAGGAVLCLVSGLYHLLDLDLTPTPGLDPAPACLGLVGLLTPLVTLYFSRDMAQLFSLGKQVGHLNTKFFTYRVTVIVVIPALMVFATNSFVVGKAFHGALLLLLLMAITAGFILMQQIDSFQGKEKINLVFFSLIVGLFGLVCINITGFLGEMDSMPWAFLLPVAAIFGLGPELGLALSLAFLAGLGLTSHLAGNLGHDQHTGMWVRFFLSQICLIAILCFMSFAIRKYRRVTEAAEAELRQHRDRLEDLVGRRTLELSHTVQKLRREVARREQFEIALVEAKNIAEAANNAKTQFLANMSHELRTPLTHIIGFTDVLLEGMVGGLTPKQKEYLGNVLSSSQHLHALISDLLDIARLEAGRLELVWSKVDVWDWISEVVGNHQNQATDNQVRLEVRHLSHQEHIWMDRLKMSQVMINLLTNAIKFSPGGEVVVEVSGRPAEQGGTCSELVVAVSDTGQGIGPGDLERIFLPFEQGENAGKLRQQGSGLGLALSRRLVELHGGRLMALSPGLGQGSRFILKLPWRDVPPPSARLGEQS